MDIDERIAELMQGAYDPLDADNLGETLSNLDVAQIATISNLLTASKYALLGAYMDTITRDHWYRLATTQAQVDHEQSCERCHGDGCSSCEDKEFIEEK